MAQISEAEKLRRRQSNEDVLGTHAMEGLFPDATTLSLLNRFAEGELSREELSEAIDRHVAKLVAANREVPAKAIQAAKEHSIA